MIKTPNTTSQAKKSEQQTQQNQQVELVNPSFNVEDTTTTLNLNETAEQTAIIQEMSTKGFSSIKNRMKQRVLKVLETPDQLFSPKAYAAMIGEEDRAVMQYGLKNKDPNVPIGFFFVYYASSRHRTKNKKLDEVLVLIFFHVSFYFWLLVSGCWSKLCCSYST